MKWCVDDFKCPHITCFKIWNNQRLLNHNECKPKDIFTAFESPILFSFAPIGW